MYGIFVKGFCRNLSVEVTVSFTLSTLGIKPCTV